MTLEESALPRWRLSRSKMWWLPAASVARPWGLKKCGAAAGPFPTSAEPSKASILRPAEGCAPAAAARSPAHEASLTARTPPPLRDNPAARLDLPLPVEQRFISPLFQPKPTASPRSTCTFLLPVLSSMPMRVPHAGHPGAVRRCSIPSVEQGELRRRATQLKTSALLQPLPELLALARAAVVDDEARIRFLGSFSGHSNGGKATPPYGCGGIQQIEQ